jgi:hypothetical protein
MLTSFAFSGVAEGSSFAISFEVELYPSLFFAVAFLTLQFSFFLCKRII